MSLSLLVVASETPDQQAARRKRAGQASHETFADTLRRIDGDVRLDAVNCVVDEGVPALDRYDGVLFAGSPIQMFRRTEETRAAAAFMARVFESGVPSFGSCAGLQIATVASGGTVEARGEGVEAGFARGIVALEPAHPMLAGRGLTWDALAMHSSEVGRRPPGMTVLARTRDTSVEAAAIRHGPGIHWGVQYHPEIAPGEVAQAVRAQTDAIVAQGMARDAAEVEAYADRIAAFGDDPERRDLAWQLGVQRAVAREGWRLLEIANFLRHLRAA